MTEDALKKRITRLRAELERIRDHNPYPAGAGGDPKETYIGYVETTRDFARRALDVDDALENTEAPPDR